MTDQLGRSFAATQSLEWRIPSVPASGPTPQVAFDQRIPTCYDSWAAAKDPAGGRFPGGQTVL